MVLITQNCCKCRIGSCSNCQCALAKRKCKNCKSTECKNMNMNKKNPLKTDLKKNNNNNTAEISNKKNNSRQERKQQKL